MKLRARGTIVAAVAAILSTGIGLANAQAAAPSADEAAFRALFKELVEINTTRSVGNCTQAAEAMQRHLLAAGIPAGDMQILAPPEAPNDGALVAVLRGRDRSVKPILLLAHIDVVEAKREDWERDPFTLVEENGWFYARGVSDDKSMAAIFTDSLDPLPEGRVHAAARHQARADLRRGDGRRGTFRQCALARADPAGGSRRRVRDQRGCGRRVRQGRQAGCTPDPGGREGVPGFLARDDGRRRPQLAPDARQRDRSAGRGYREARRPPVPDHPEPRDPELFRGHVEARGSRHRERHARRAEVAPGRGGRAKVVDGRPVVERHAAHDLHRERDRGRPRPERNSPEREGDRQLPHHAGHARGRRAGRDRAGSLPTTRSP